MPGPMLDQPGWEGLREQLLRAAGSRQEDAVQEVLLRLVPRNHSRPEEEIRDVPAYAGCVLRRLLWQWAREGGPTGSEPTQNLTDGCEEPSDLVARDEEVARLRGVLRSLPERDSELIDLRYREGLKVQDVANRLGITRDAAASRLVRLRGRLAVLLLEQGL